MKKKSCKIVFLIVGLLVLMALTGLAYVKLALPDVGPAPVMKISATKARIDHGRYLANHVALCIDCHSTRDYSKQTAPVVAGTEGKGGEGFLREQGFPGNYYAPNLTPDHLGSWTDGEIYRAITTGVSRDGHALFPVMPYQNFAQMPPEDIKDVIAYLRSLPSIRHDVPASEPDFPMNFIINTLPAPSPGGQRPSTADSIAYGRYVTTFASCGECHTQRDDRGNLVPGMDFAGGRAFPLPTGTVYSANITPAKTGIGTWTRDAFIARFKAHANGNVPADVHDGEPNSVMPWPMYAGMSEQDLGAVYDYLHSLKPVEAKSRAFVPKAKLVAER
jgi:mono/diheme cytochrome c family protein